MHVTRRRFLKHTLAATAACGLARVAVAGDAPSSDEIIDTHVYVGHWPNQRLLDEDLANLVTLLQTSNVSQAWVGSFEGLFHKDIAAVNQRLADLVKSVASQFRPIQMHPFGTINPTLPDWEDDVRRCHETFEMRGVRLHPNYHGYTLDDPRFSQLLEMCTANELIVQLVCWMDDDRRRVLSPNATRVDLKPLAKKVTSLNELRLVISNGYQTANDEAIRALLPMKQICFDFAQATNEIAIRELADRTSANRVLFGSGTPLHDIAAPLAVMQKAQLKGTERSAIQTKNAKQLIASRRAD
jgi:predicted TIM-barrel fold metal-dependent hydrolase